MRWDHRPERSGESFLYQITQLKSGTLCGSGPMGVSSYAANKLKDAIDQGAGK